MSTAFRPGIVRYFFLVVTVMFLAVALPGFAEDAPAKEEISPELMEEAVGAMKAYIYASPPSKKSFEVFDAKKMKKVVLKLKRVSKKDPLEQLTDKKWALSVDSVAEDKSKYVLWMVMSHQPKTENAESYGGAQHKIPSLGAMVVHHVWVKSVDGEPRTKIVKKDDGTRDIVPL